MEGTLKAEHTLKGGTPLPLVSKMVADAKSVNSTRIASYINSHADMQELIKIAARMREIPDRIALTGSDHDDGKVVVSVGSDAQRSGFDAGAIVREICIKIGGSGGGKLDMAEGRRS